MSETPITPALLASFFGHDFLSYDALDETAREYDFSQNYNPEVGDGDEQGWKVADHPDLESQVGDLNTVEASVEKHAICVELSVGYMGSTFTVTLPEHEAGEVSEDALLTAVRAQLEDFEIEGADTAELGDRIEVECEDDGFDALCELCDIDPEIFEQDDPEDDDRWCPMMNYLYPLPRGVRGTENWHRVMSNMTLVNVDGEEYLALTGGGMDMTWPICETYLRCGYLPPAVFASRLPRMSGNGQSEQDRMIMAACMFSLKGTRDRAIRAIEDLERHMLETEEKAEAS